MFPHGKAVVLVGGLCLLASLALPGPAQTLPPQPTGVPDPQPAAGAQARDVPQRVQALTANKSAPALDIPTSRTRRTLEGWTVLVDDRLLHAPNDELGTRALRFLEGKLADIQAVVPEERLHALKRVTIVLDLTHGQLTAMQYHPSAEWLKNNGYDPDLAKCVHLPRAADLATPRNIREQPWVILHELAHAYHDQVLGFDEPRILEAYQRYRQRCGDEKTLHCNGRRVKHYALTNHKEFFAEMTESYFGVNDFFPFNRGELKESQPEIYQLLRTVWEEPSLPSRMLD
jgi:hypothetical protein